MSKKLIITDTHLGMYQDSDKWLDVVLRYFTDVKNYCKESNIEEVIHLGDFFDNRKQLNTKTQHAAHDIAEMFSNLHVRIIVGNHDCYYKNQISPNTLELFKEYKNIEIIDKPTETDNIMLVPWGAPIEKSKASYCFGHFAINGFHMNDSYVCKNGVDGNAFNDYKLVLSGHFHTSSRQGNIIYIGTGYGQTFHDAGHTKGFYEFNDGNLTFIEYNKAPKFIKMKTDAIDESIIEGNIIKLIFTEDLGTTKNQKLVDKIISKNPFLFSVNFANVGGEEENEEVNDIKMEKREEIIENFIDSKPFPTNIQVGILKSMFKNIMKEAEEI